MTRRMKPFRDGRVVVLVVYIVAKTDSRNIDSVGEFFKSDCLEHSFLDRLGVKINLVQLKLLYFNHYRR